jgi:hypothetical protein
MYIYRTNLPTVYVRVLQWKKHYGYIICEIVPGHVMVQVSIGKYTHTPPVVCKQIYPGTSLYTHTEQKKG